MDDHGRKLVIGALLHDIGKVIYRAGSDTRKHSRSGYDYLRNDAGIEDADILECVLYHHAKELRSSGIAKDSLAYIVYMADNIASAADRRKKDSEDVGFDVHMPLQPVFNILNGNSKNMWYMPYLSDIENDINFPCEEKKAFDKSHYSKIFSNIKENLMGIEWTDEYINSLIESLEANLSYIPSSTSNSELADISLYDHLRLTAAVASCILEYLRQNKIDDYKDRLFDNSESFYYEKAFLLVSMDISGIQKFIYTIISKNALRMLRARSFYLELMMEHIIDEILEKERLSRANLIYSGGGHCYLLLPNTDDSRQIFDEFMRATNEWLINEFRTDLYIAGAYVECSSNCMKNYPVGRYSELFRELSDRLGMQKTSRYTSSQIRMLNGIKYKDYTRECSVCKSLEEVNSDGICRKCQALKDFSANVLYSDFFVVTKDKAAIGLPLPNEYTLSTANEIMLKDMMENDGDFVRSYGKNKMYTGKRVSTKLWVGNYTNGETFEQMANAATGANRIGVLRADVDNLGQAIVSGFSDESNNDRYVTLSRTAALSRQLSMFFKLYINKILSKPSFSIRGENKYRNATIVYSGGDDLFIVGAWNDVIELAIDIKKNFSRYTEGTLTLSGGIGIYGASYPISVMADEVAILEEKSKQFPGKSAITLLDDGCRHKIKDNGVAYDVLDGTYSWDEFENKVIEEKYKTVSDFFSANNSFGNSFIYHILELIRMQGDKINFARYVYLLSRMEPEREAGKDAIDRYRLFSKRMYEWIQYEEDRRQLKTAITLYVYGNREKEDI